jgi:hypothetical protein
MFAGRSRSTSVNSRPVHWGILPGADAIPGFLAFLPPQDSEPPRVYRIGQALNGRAFPMETAFDVLGAPFALASRTDLGSVVFEAEALTGARP